VGWRKEEPGWRRFRVLSPPQTRCRPSSCGGKPALVREARRCGRHSPATGELA